MLQRLMPAIVRQWHHPTVIGQFALRPLSWLYAVLTTLRRASYRVGLLRSVRLPVPTVVVGNLTVGGSGKTPLVGHLVSSLAAAGWRPGIVIRGYGGSGRGPRRVDATSDPAVTGDEAVLHARLARRPVATGADRPAAARLLLDDCDVIVADDGLQHYRLARDLEVIVIDGDTGLGNGQLLPAGSLRESARLLRGAAFVAIRDGEREGAWGYRVEPVETRRLIDGVRRPLEDWRGRKVHAVAAIGVPGRFFGQLEDLGLDVERHGFPDHHVFRAHDFAFGGGDPVLMTEKDAVKCHAFMDERMWAVTTRLVDLHGLADAVVRRLETMRPGALDGSGNRHARDPAD